MHFMQYQSLVATMQNDAAAMLGNARDCFQKGLSAMLGARQAGLRFLAISSSCITALQWTVEKCDLFPQIFIFATVHNNDGAAQLFEAAFEPSLKGSRRRRRKTLVQQQ